MTGSLAGLMVQANLAAPVVLARQLTAVHEATGAGIVLRDDPVASGVAISTGQILETGDGITPPPAAR